MVQAGSALTHINPVYDGYFADPFVWRHKDCYFAVGTGAREALHQPAEKIFPLLRSSDFVHWELVCHALVRPEASLGETFWAPAVAFCDGIFYLYYSVGHADRAHQLRVASSHAPAGPYLDSGRALLPPERTPFAIDPHPFQDVDGRWYMFYACDFLNSSTEARPGTALMVRSMKNMSELEDTGKVVLRARSDWQRFQADRRMYGRVWDWHTLEGPCVVRHESRYYCFYSGGRWENESYGVDYGIAAHVLGPYSDAGNESGPRVLRTCAGQRLGPGHNSHVVGPNGAEYLVYHAWNQEMTLRQMCIDQLIWTDLGPRCAGSASGALRGNILH